MRIVQKHYLFLLLTVCLVTNVGTIYAQTTVDTDITSDTTWTTAGSPYVISGIVTVEENVTLTIDPGVVIKFDGFDNLLIEGTLIAEGTSADSILFTSIKDDAYGGDTNNDGSATSPSAGDWGYVDIRESSGSSSRIAYSIFRYGGQGTGFGQDGALRTSASPDIRSSLFYQSKRGFVATGASAPVVEDNRFVENDETPITVSLTSTASFSGNVFENNEWDGLGLEYGTYDGVHTLSQRTLAGITNIPYVIANPAGRAFTIDTGASLTVDPGVVVKFNQGDFLRVEGTLIAEGTSADSILFTSIKDDAYGGDTNNDGSATSPSAGDWGYVDIRESSGSSSRIAYSIFRYGGQGTGFGQDGALRTSASPDIRSSLFYQSKRGFVATGASAPVVEDNRFVENDETPITVSLTSTASFSGNVFENNEWDGLGLEYGTYDGVHTLSQRTLAGITNIPYVVALPAGRALTISDGATLTIDPGVVVKFNQGDDLRIEGTLLAEGTPADSIVFTSIEDDAYGGDTNNDGSATSPSPGDWGYVSIGQSSGSSSRIAYSIFRFGGFSDTGALRIWASPEVDNSLFYKNEKGIVCLGSGVAQLTDNTLTKNKYGISSEGASPVVHNNRILENTMFDFENLGSADIDAQSNWWGLDTFLEIASGNNPKDLGAIFDVFDDPTKGAVDYANWLVPDSAIFSISPDSAATGETAFQETILGYPFSDSASVRLRKPGHPDLIPTTTTVVNETQIDVTFDFTDAPSGTWNLVVVNAETDSLTLDAALTLYEPLIIPFGEWVEFQVIDGSLYIAGVNIPSVDDLFIFVKKATRIGYAGTWFGDITLTKQGEVVTSESGPKDFDIQLQSPEPGFYMIELESTDPGDGFIKLTTAPDTLNLGTWSLGEILRPYGYDWKQIDVPPGQDSLFLETEGFGLWSTLDVYYDSLSNDQQHWQFSNHGAGYHIEGLIENPPPGRYYLRYMDSAVLQGTNDQTRQYLIFADTSPIETPPPVELTITGLSTYEAGMGPVTLITSGMGFSATDSISVALVREGFDDFVAQGVFADSSGTELTAVFDFTEAESGEWDLVVRNDEGESTTAPGQFTILSGIQQQLCTELIGRSQIRVGRTQTYVVEVQNCGTIDIPFAHINISVPDTSGIQFLNFENNDLVLDSLDWGDVDQTYVSDGRRYLPLYISNLEVGGRKPIQFKLKASLGQSAFIIRVTGAIVGKAWFLEEQERAAEEIRLFVLDDPNTPIEVMQLAQDPEMWWDRWKEVLEELGYQVSDSVSSNIGSLLKNREHSSLHIPVGPRPAPPKKVVTYLGLFAGILDALFPNPLSLWLALTNLFVQISMDVAELKDNARAEELGPRDPNAQKPSPKELQVDEPLTSTTPEDKFGPVGYDPVDTLADSLQRFVSASQAFEYRIDFWNHEDATAPAQEVFIRDTLDVDFDLFSLNFKEFGFLRWKRTFGGGQYFNTTVDLRPDMDLLVDVEGSVDPEARAISWVFRSLDPATGELPDDPLAGFLPPIDSTGYQIGWVTYTIEPKESLPTGTTITNQARVNFDGVGPWNPAPKDAPFLNTLDVDVPTSQILPLATTQDAINFDIQWTGSDVGTGILDYSVFVAEDGGSFTPWKVNTTDTAATFIGEPGKSYAFYSVARDHVGHLEAVPLTPDATTTITTTSTHQVDAIAAWNLIGLPLAVLDPNYQSLFPNAITGTLFGFNGSYFTPDPSVLALGSGYWLRFPQAEAVTLSGAQVTELTTTLEEGWNMVAGLSCSASLSDASDPDSILVDGTLFGFNGGYFQPNPPALEPGSGYWLRTSAAGQITLRCPNGGKVIAKRKEETSALENFGQVVLRDDSGGHQALYFGLRLPENVDERRFSLPPAPPAGIFDVRFTDGTYVTENAEAVIRLQAKYYPLLIRTTRLPGGDPYQYEIRELIEQTEGATHILEAGATIEISDPRVQAIKLVQITELPEQFVVDQNYPNPFNPTTTIRYGLPEAAKVRMTVYNILGQRVAVVLEAEQQAGYHQVVWDGRNAAGIRVASGVYFYVVQADKHRMVRKMVLIK